MGLNIDISDSEKGVRFNQHWIKGVVQLFCSGNILYLQDTIKILFLPESNVSVSPPAWLNT